MTDQITVNVEDLRELLAHAAANGEACAVTERAHAALDEYDKAEQERNGQLVMVHKDDVDVISHHSPPDRWATTFRYPYYEAAPETVEALGVFYPHQTDHAFDSRATPGVCFRCGSPEWAHTPPAVPDWQTDPDVLVVEDRDGSLWRRAGEFSWQLNSGYVQVPHWATLQENHGPIRPVGWRRDPDSITLPGVLRDRSADWWRDAADHGAKQGYPRHVNLACRLIADALEES